jgi:CMP-N-acetylneuraminic acid synthetase
MLNGHPLVTYPILAGKALQLPVYLSTDSLEIGAVGQEHGAEICWRPNSLASDTATDKDWISHFLTDYWSKKSKPLPSHIIFLRPTTPLRCMPILLNAINSFKPTSSGLRSVEELPEPIEKTFRVTTDGYIIPSCTNISMADTNRPAQHFPIAYKANGYIDILRPEVVLKNVSIYGDKIQPYITPITVDIDSEEDFNYAEFLIGNQFNI